jgi:putative membrane protein
MQLLLNWLVSAVSLLIASYVIPGFHVSGFQAALIAALVIGIINATIGLFLKIVTFPVTLLTLGIFWWVINALMIMLASRLVSGFEVSGFLPALLGAVVLSLVQTLLRSIVKRAER